jgi:hypothetical protein
MHHPAVDVYLIHLQPTGFRDPEPVPEGEKDQTTVAYFVSAPLRGLDQLIHFTEGQVLPPAAVVAGFRGVRRGELSTK